MPTCTSLRRREGSRVAAGIGTAVSTLVGAACAMFTSPDSDQCYAQAVAVAPASPELDVGQRVTLGATVTFSNPGRDCRPDRAIVGWQILDPGFASLGVPGAQQIDVTGLAAGQARVVATVGADSAQNRPADTILVKVTPVTVASLTLSSTQVAVVVGNSVPVTATVRNTLGEDITARSSIAWAVTTNPTVATVSQSGVISGVAKGPARVTVTATAMAGTATATIDVTVSDPPNVGVAEIQLGGPAFVQAAKTIELSATVRAPDGTILTDRAITWSTDASTQATVEPKAGGTTVGVVSGNKVGKANITARAEGKSATMEVTVIPGEITRVAVTPANVGLRVGRTAQLSAQALDARNNVVPSPFTWSSVSPSVATVDAAGLVTAVGAGSTSVDAHAGTVTGSASLAVTIPRVAYAFANKPLSASYSPDNAYNSTGGTITVTRRGTGSYRVQFGGQRAGGQETETVLVTRQGDDNRYCKAASWTSAPPDLIADVVCFDFGGTAADAEFAITLLGDGALGGRFGFAFADQPTAASYSPANYYNSSPLGAGPLVRVARTAAGRYTVTFTGNGDQASIVPEALHVAAVGTSGSWCHLASPLTSETALVRCYSGVAGDEQTVDSPFAITLLDRGRGGGRVAGYAYATNLADNDSEFEIPGTYTLPAVLAYNSSTGTVDVTKSNEVGRYEVLFHGLAPLAGTPLTVQVVNQDSDDPKYCNAVSWALVGPDIRVTVKCWHGGDGEPDDEKFYVLVLQ